MINSLNAVFEKQDIKINLEADSQKKFFDKNGYCVIEKSELPVEKFAEIIDFLLEKEAWRGRQRRVYEVWKKLSTWSI